MPRVPNANETANRLSHHVLGNKEDTAVSSVGTTASLMAYVKGLLSQQDTPTEAGSVFAVQKTVTHDQIDSTGVDLTGVSSGGALLVEDIIVQTATAMTSAANGAVLNIVNNNTLGNAAFFTAAEAKLGANATVDFKNATTAFKSVIETGKKLTAKATTEDFTSTEDVTITLILRRLASGATIAAA